MRYAIDSRSALTTEHPASSYGIPVLLIDGRSYGPRDLLPETVEGCPSVTVAEALSALVATGVVRRRGNSFKGRSEPLPAEVVEMIRQFCEQGA